MHTHVEASLGGEVKARDMLARTFGLVGDLPGTVRNRDVARRFGSLGR